MVLKAEGSRRDISARHVYLENCVSVAFSVPRTVEDRYIGSPVFLQLKENDIKSILSLDQSAAAILLSNL